MEWFDSIGGLLINITIGFVLLIAVICLPVSYYGVKAEIEQFKSIRTTLESARQNKNISQYEIAAIQQNVVDANKWLANAKYWNSTIFDMYIPDEIEKLEPIK